MTREFNAAMLVRCAICDERFSKQREDILLRSLERTDRLEELKALSDSQRVAATAEVQRLRAQIDQLHAVEPPGHGNVEHAASVSQFLRRSGCASYGLAIAAAVALFLYGAQDAAPTHWSYSVFWSAVFGGPVLVAFCFYSAARPLLSPFNCIRCFLILAGSIAAILIPLWGLCTHLEVPLNGYSTELFLTVLGGLAVPEISRAFRCKNHWFRVSKPQP